MGSKVTINGKTYRGNNISIQNGTVYVDGKAVDDSEPDDNGILKVQITGDVGLVECDRSVTVKGNVNGDVRAKGSVRCGAIGGNVDAGGSVRCDDVGESVDAGGSVRASQISGSVCAGGSVKGI